MTVLDVARTGEQTEPQDGNDCCCDFIEIIEDAGERFELHHVIPDDGAPHATTLECGCHPDVERVEYDLIVVGHKDQDIDLALDGEEDPWSSPSGSTGAAPAPSSRGSC